jgi:hypothetical protein
MQTYKRRLSFKLLFTSGNNDIFKYLPPVKDYFFTESVRGGLEAIIDQIWEGNPGMVLLPVFLAEGVIRPFKIKKVPVVFYKLDEKLSPDISDIKFKLTRFPEIKSIVVIHYFGFPQDFGGIRQLCNERSIFMFEDCVHALFSKKCSGEYVGLIGDISFFSFSKILPTPDGAIFFLNHPDVVNIKNKLKYRQSLAGQLMVWIHIVYLLIKNIEVKLDYSMIYRILRFITKGINVFYYHLLNHSIKPKHISKVSLRILKNIDYDRLIDSRKQHIKNIFDTLAPFNFPFFRNDVSPNFMLTGVPVLSKNFEEIIGWLQKNNIECLSYKKAWFFMPKGTDNEFILEAERFHNHFLLPIHEENSDYSEILIRMMKTLFSDES